MAHPAQAISLVAFGALLDAAQFAPRTIATVPGTLGAVDSLRSFLEGQGPSYAATSLKLDLAHPALASEGILDLRAALFTNEPLRESLISRLHTDEILTKPVVLDAIIRSCRVLGPCPIADLLSSGEVTQTEVPPSLITRLFGSAMQLQPLQLIAGAAWVHEQKKQLDWAKQLYKWYLIFQEQIDQGLEEVDPTFMEWGVGRLIAVSDIQGDDELAAKLRRIGSPSEPVELLPEIDFDLVVVEDLPAQTPVQRSLSHWPIDLAQGAYVSDEEIKRRVLAQLAEMSPGDTATVTLHTTRLGDLTGHANRLREALESSPLVSNLIGGRISVRSVEFQMEYRLTVQSMGGRLLVNLILGQAR